MTYDEAMGIAYRDNTSPVRRAHWRTFVASRPDPRDGKKRILVIVDKDGTRGDKFRATADELSATDWIAA